MPSRNRHPFKSQPRDQRAHGIIERYLDTYGADSGREESLPMPHHGAANEGRLSIRRGARHYGVSAAAWVTGEDGANCGADCPEPQAPHALVFSLWSKDHGRAHVAAEASGDPARLKYNPYGPRW